MRGLKKEILGNKRLRWILLGTNWFFQGIPHSDKSEKVYKIFFTFVISLVVLLLLGISIFNVFFSFFFGHTINWLLNCNLAVILIHRMKWLKTSPSQLFHHLNSIRDQLIDKDWLLFAVTSGGIVRGTMNEHSDIDVNLVRKPGIRNAVRSILFSIKERKRADLNGIPLDIIVSDSIENCLQKTNYTKKIITLYNPNNIVNKHFNKVVLLKDAQAFNLQNIKNVKKSTVSN